ncbi:MAG: hypothetical protein JXR63_08935 [Spirochaetales bacterium]|nr:hypothetical protein [Spirochaetales bacterium]
MDNQQNYINQLEEILDERRTFILHEVLFRMKNELSYYTMTFGNLYKIFLNNGILGKDMYREDFKISNIGVPSEEKFSDKKSKEELSIRLSQFDSYLNFLLTYCTFSIEYFNPENVKKVASLIQYIKWEQFTPGSDHFLTAELAKLIENDHNVKQDFTAKILSDSTKQLIKHTKNIMRDLKILSDFDRESYKLEFRKSVLSTVALSSSMLSNMEGTLNALKKVAASKMPNRVFFSNLVKEIIYEELDSSGDDLKEEVLKKLQAGGAKKVQERKASPDEILAKAIKTLASANPFVSEALVKLSANSTNLDTEKESFFVRFLVALHVLPKANDKDRYIEIDLAEESSGVSIKKTINVNSFIKSAKKTIDDVSSVKSKMSSNSEDKALVLEEFNNAITSYIKLVKMLSAINDFFKDKKGPQGVMRNIATEITSIKNYISSARALRNDYYTIKGEENLLKK